MEKRKRVLSHRKLTSKSRVKLMGSQKTRMTWIGGGYTG